ncbi:hypothetical protein BT96DRAFT_948238 [Gymnopus androsaceus JB14]|uniref:Uncharacterized protein n=1 Tax=Gymnopus androsaceus JB14 TaxID=1447944 RepID=A0A6A4GQL3_9AGAR|nr:hypothetical protein BT96DRAFT_948238 [Gymnopus androsaceus JB14]
MHRFDESGHGPPVGFAPPEMWSWQYGVLGVDVKYIRDQKQKQVQWMKRQLVNGFKNDGGTKVVVQPPKKHQRIPFPYVDSPPFCPPDHWVEPPQDAPMAVTPHGFLSNFSPSLFLLLPPPGLEWICQFVCLGPIAGGEPSTNDSCADLAICPWAAGKQEVDVKYIYTLSIVFDLRIAGSDHELLVEIGGKIWIGNTSIPLMYNPWTAGDVRLLIDQCGLGRGSLR